MLLRKADVVEGALKFLDAEGLDGLTMRKLGAALNVHGGALYRHFPNKAALLEAMANKLTEGVGAPLPEGPWRNQIYVLGQRFRTAMLAHRDGARLVSGTHATGANSITAGSLVVDVLCGAGLTPAQAGSLAFSLYYYVLGHTLDEQNQAHAPDEGWQGGENRLASTLSPRYAEAFDSLMNTDPTERFAYGLNTFIEGVASRIPPAPATAPGTPAPRASSTGPR
ncbi:TetR/AcrR family transcriptional regulator C-terminal domain-containing protein [Streptomyces sp. SP17KL33]|uniref:TetR/AcrR family transcriptional regulator C-terminal domain-containing protein n=1 Tax=Streptomyces sp. SP17KL33 TaxID=3002534 RepID=UPI002E76EE9B|nr:TetR/AcrR family transcriptional regulator C-terminal domain-containing protein [Streptomyces sp. SP17KL33]MEE1835687.1 TetR/AcrR family transcriptional regulator C-terminal domain-containing protein [Streptomyces sp. SP17KL33]